jgi:hypothetical protein
MHAYNLSKYMCIGKRSEYEKRVKDRRTSGEQLTRAIKAMEQWALKEQLYKEPDAIGQPVAGPPLAPPPLRQQAPYFAALRIKSRRRGFPAHATVCHS